MEKLQFSATLLLGLFLGAIATLAWIENEGLKTARANLATYGIYTLLLITVITVVPIQYLFWLLIPGLLIGPYLFRRFGITEKLVKTLHNYFSKKGGSE